MAFHEMQFPAALSFGSVGGPERRTDIVTLSNGYEERNTPWAHSRRRYDAGVGLRSLNDVAQIVAFFEAREGQLHSFRWKDWGDYKSCAPLSAPVSSDQLIAVGDEVTTVVQLVKSYRSGDQAYLRPITKPVEGSVRVTIGGDEMQESIDYTVDFTTGEVIFPHPPDLGAEVRAGFEFDVPVRFDTDIIQTSVSSFRAGDAPNVPIVEVRV